MIEKSEKSILHLKKNSILSLFVTLILSCTTLILLFSKVNSSIIPPFIFATLVYIWIILSWFSIFRTLLNSYSIFILITYVFFFGQYFLAFINAPLNSGITIYTIFTISDFVFSAYFVLLSILMLHTGALVGVIADKKNRSDILYEKKVTIQKSNFNDSSSLKIVAISLLLISYVPTIIILSNYIRIVFTSGYGQVFHSEYYTSGGFSNILGFLSTFVIPALLSSIIAFRNSKYLKLILMLTGIYIIMYFLSGSRYNAVLVILSILLIKKYFLDGKNIRVNLKFVFLLFLAVIILGLISSIRSQVSASGNFYELLINALVSLFKSNVIFSFLREFGFTMIATTTVFVNTPTPINFANGETYFASILRVFPNLFWDVHPAAKISVDSVFKSFVTSYGGIGSSFIAEGYYNFGFYSILLMPLFGFLLYKLFISIVRASRKNNIAKGSLYIYIFSFTLFYVRSDTISFWRNIIYFGVFPIVFFTIIRNTLKGR